MGFIEESNICKTYLTKTSCELYYLIFFFIVLNIYAMLWISCIKLKNPVVMPIELYIFPLTINLIQNKTFLVWNIQHVTTLKDCLVNLYWRRNIYNNCFFRKMNLRETLELIFKEICNNNVYNHSPNTFWVQVKKKKKRKKCLYFCVSSC